MLPENTVPLNLTVKSLLFSINKKDARLLLQNKHFLDTTCSDLLWGFGYPFCISLLQAHWGATTFPASSSQNRSRATSTKTTAQKKMRRPDLLVWEAPKHSWANLGLWSCYHHRNDHPMSLRFHLPRSQQKPSLFQEASAAVSWKDCIGLDRFL